MSGPSTPKEQGLSPAIAASTPAKAFSGFQQQRGGPKPFLTPQPGKAGMRSSGNWNLSSNTGISSNFSEHTFSNNNNNNNSYFGPSSSRGHSGGGNAQQQQRQCNSPSSALQQQTRNSSNIFNTPPPQSSSSAFRPAMGPGNHDGAVSGKTNNHSFSGSGLSGGRGGFFTPMPTVAGSESMKSFMFSRVAGATSSQQQLLQHGGDLSSTAATSQSTNGTNFRSLFNGGGDPSSSSFTTSGSTGLWGNRGRQPETGKRNNNRPSPLEENSLFSSSTTRGQGGGGPSTPHGDGTLSPVTPVMQDSTPPPKQQPPETPVKSARAANRGGGAAHPMNTPFCSAPTSTPFHGGFTNSNNSNNFFSSSSNHQHQTSLGGGGGGVTPSRRQGAVSEIPPSEISVVSNGGGVGGYPGGGYYEDGSYLHDNNNTSRMTLMSPGSLQKANRNPFSPYLGRGILSSRIEAKEALTNHASVVVVEHSVPSAAPSAAPSCSATPAVGYLNLTTNGATTTGNSWDAPHQQQQQQASIHQPPGPNAFSRPALPHTFGGGEPSSHHSSLTTSPNISPQMDRVGTQIYHQPASTLLPPSSAGGAPSSFFASPQRNSLSTTPTARGRGAHPPRQTIFAPPQRTGGLFDESDSDDDGPPRDEDFLMTPPRAFEDQHQQQYFGAMMNSGSLRTVGDSSPSTVVNGGEGSSSRKGMRPPIPHDFTTYTNPAQYSAAPQIFQTHDELKFCFYHRVPWKTAQPTTAGSEGREMQQEEEDVEEVQQPIPLHQDLNGTVWLATNIVDGMPYAVKQVFYNNGGEDQQHDEEEAVAYDDDRYSRGRSSSRGSTPSQRAGVNYHHPHSVPTHIKRNRSADEHQFFSLSSGSSSSSSFNPTEIRALHLSSRSPHIVRIYSSFRQQQPLEPLQEQQASSQQQYHHSSISNSKKRMIHVVQTEYFSRGNLFENILRRSAPLSDHEVHKVLCQVLKGLKTLHDEGIAHRNLTLMSIFIADDGTYKIGNFGACVDVFAAEEESDREPSQQAQSRFQSTGTTRRGNSRPPPANKTLFGEGGILGEESSDDDLDESAAVATNDEDLDSVPLAGPSPCLPKVYEPSNKSGRETAFTRDMYSFITSFIHVLHISLLKAYRTPEDLADPKLRDDFSVDKLAVPIPDTKNEHGNPVQYFSQEVLCALQNLSHDDPNVRPSVDAALAGLQPVPETLLHTIFTSYEKEISNRKALISEMKQKIQQRRQQKLNEELAVENNNGSGGLRLPLTRNSSGGSILTSSGTPRSGQRHFKKFNGGSLFASAPGSNTNTNFGGNDSGNSSSVASHNYALAANGSPANKFHNRTHTLTSVFDESADSLTPGHDPLNEKKFIEETVLATRPHALAGGGGGGNNQGGGGGGLGVDEDPNNQLTMSSSPTTLLMKLPATSRVVSSSTGSHDEVRDPIVALCKGDRHAYSPPKSKNRNNTTTSHQHQHQYQDQRSNHHRGVSTQDETLPEGEPRQLDPTLEICLQMLSDKLSYIPLASSPTPV